VIGFNEGYNSVSPCKSASPTKTQVQSLASYVANALHLLIRNKRITPRAKCAGSP